MNPKDLVGSKKAPLGLVPAALEIGASEAMENGAAKYGPFNWREQPIEFMSYLVAMKRHIAALIDGQDFAEDTGIHHLKHVAAGAGILLDAMGIPGDLIDNRPPKGPAADLLRAMDRSVSPAVAPAPEELVLGPNTRDGTAEWPVEEDRLIRPEYVNLALDFYAMGMPLPDHFFVGVEPQPTAPEDWPTETLRHVTEPPALSTVTDAEAVAWLMADEQVLVFPKHDDDRPVPLGSPVPPQIPVVHEITSEEWGAGDGPVVGSVTMRGWWPPDTRVAGRLTCCGQTEHAVDCPQWR